MSGHTPGPWQLSGKQSVRGPSGEYIAKANWDNGQDNARLMTAAPELLEALINVRDNVKGDSPDMWGAVDAAIAKALGIGDTRFTITSKGREMLAGGK